MRQLHAAAACTALIVSALALQGCPPSGPSFADQINVGLIISSNPPDVTQPNQVTFPTFLQDASDHVWEVDGMGILGSGEKPSAGTDNAFSFFFALFVNGELFPLHPAADVQDGFEVVYGPAMTGGVNVTRKVFVSQQRGFVRWLDILENPTNSSTSVSVTMSGSLLSNEVNGMVDASTDGNETLEPTDIWWTNCQDHPSDPCVGHFFCGGVGTKSLDDFSFNYGVIDIPANDRVILINYAMMRTNRLNISNALFELQTELESLEMMPMVDSDFLEGMTMSELNDILECGGNVTVDGQPDSAQPNAMVTVSNSANGETRTTLAGGMGAWQVAVPGQTGDTLTVSTSQGQSATLTVP